MRKVAALWPQFVDGEGEAKLCDFGISSTITKGQKRSTVIGTPYYLAPEIITEKGIYSL